MNPQVARSKTRLRFIFGLKVKSKLSRVRWASRKPAGWRRRSSRRSERRVSSSETRHEIRSMGGIDSACAWRKRVSSTAAMPPRRSWVSARCSSIRFMGSLLVQGCGVLLSAGLNEIAVQRELADERIDLAQVQRQLRTAFQVAAHEVIFRRAGFQGHGAGVLRGRDAVLLGHREHAQNAAHRDFSVMAMQALAKSADVLARLFATRQQS